MSRRLAVAAVLAALTLAGCSTAGLTTDERDACNASRDSAWKDKSADHYADSQAWRKCVDAETAD